MEDQFHFGVYANKLRQKTYHLAQFKEPLTKDDAEELPPHIIEKPDPAVKTEKE